MKPLHSLTQHHFPHTWQSHDRRKFAHRHKIVFTPDERVQVREMGLCFHTGKILEEGVDIWPSSGHLSRFDACEFYSFQVDAQGREGSEEAFCIATETLVPGPELALPMKNL